MALHVLGADVQQSNPGPLHAIGHPVIRLAEYGELHQPFGVTVDVRTSVQECGNAPEPRPGHHQRRTLHGHAHPQDQAGDGHQAARAAAGDGGDRFPGLYRLDGVPHRGTLAPADGRRGLLVRGDDLVCMADLGAPGELRVAGKLGPNPGLVPMQQEPHGRGHALQSDGQARNCRRNPVIAAHGVDGNDTRFGQQTQPAPTRRSAQDTGPRRACKSAPVAGFTDACLSTH